MNNELFRDCFQTGFMAGVAINIAKGEKVYGMDWEL
jgi:hypothetical protein